MRSNSRIIVFMVVFLINIVNHATVGTQNMTINVGGGFNYTALGMNTGTSTERKDSRQEYFGGGFNIELGHLYLSQGSIIHGADTRLGFGMNYNELDKVGGNTAEFPEGASRHLNTINFSVGSTYVIGTQINNGCLLIDILGLNIGYLTGSVDSNILVVGTENITKMKTGNSFLLGINLPLGVHYIFDNGFSIGFRHRLDFAFGGEPQVADSTEIKDNTITLLIDKVK